MSKTFEFGKIQIVLPEDRIQFIAGETIRGRIVVD